MALIRIILLAALAVPSSAPSPTTAGSADDDWLDFPDEATMAPSALPTLTTVAEVKRLTPEQAARHYPVKLRGNLAYIAAQPAVLFLQDETGGICVTGPRDREVRAQMRLGVPLEIEGITAAGALTPYVTGRDREPVRITLVGGPRRWVPRRVTVARLLDSIELHGDLVEVEAIVRSVRTVTLGAAPAEAVLVSLVEDGRRLEVMTVARNADPATLSAMVGATVRARGVYYSSSPGPQQLASMKLLVQTLPQVRVTRPSTPPFALQVARMEELGADPEYVAAGRTRVQGVVTLASGTGMFVEADGAAVWAGAPEGATDVDAAQPGEKVDVVGFPGRRGWSVVLEDAVWRKLGPARLPPAPVVTAEQALAGKFNGRLVRVEALVLSVSRLAEGPTLVLQSGDHVFLARPADHGTSPAPFESLREGSWVRATGVCVNNRMPGDTSAAPDDARAGARPVSFHLLLGTPDAVQLISAPGWWTLRRVLAVCGVLAAVALAAATWVVALRRRVARQTSLIRQHLARETLYEERVRIARELHDSLEQDLLGITLQLNATEKQLGHPEQARRALQLASAMVRRSQAETHRAVWDLRERRPGQEGLVPAVREAVAGLSPGASSDGNGSGPEVDVEVSGEPVALPRPVENHLMRVALEAVTNALKHAGAKHIGVHLDFGEERVELRVSDDGRGFNADELPPPTTGHFGLFGMRERAEKLHGELTIRSSPGNGTEIRLVVPIPKARLVEVTRGGGREP